MICKECPPDTVFVERTPSGDLVCELKCVSVGGECEPGTSRACPNGYAGNQVCNSKCRWEGACVPNPDPPKPDDPKPCRPPLPPTCTGQNCGFSCTWEELTVNKQYECAVATRRPAGRATVGMPVRLFLTCQGGSGKEEKERGNLDSPPGECDLGSPESKPDNYCERYTDDGQSKYHVIKPSVLCSIKWVHRLVADYSFGCIPDETVWDMDEHPDNVGKRSSNIVSRLLRTGDPALDPLTYPRTTLEIMRETNPNDPLLILAERRGAEVRHIYERSSAGKQTTTVNRITGEREPAYHVRAKVKWFYNVNFFFTWSEPACTTERINKNCPVDENKCPCEWRRWEVVDDEGKRHCGCQGLVHKRKESPPVPMGIIGGESTCPLVREEGRSSMDCNGVLIPVQEIQSLVR